MTGSNNIQRNGSISSTDGFIKQGFGQGSNDVEKPSQSQSQRNSHLVNATNSKQINGIRAHADDHVHGGHSHRSSSSSASPPRSSSSCGHITMNPSSHPDGDGAHCHDINIDTVGHRHSSNGTSTSPSTITSTTVPITTKPTKPITTAAATTTTAVVISQKQKRKEQNNIHSSVEEHNVSNSQNKNVDHNTNK